MLSLRRGLAQADRMTSDATPAADDAPFAELLKGLIPGLRRHLQRQLGSADATDDAVQETCLRMLRYRGIGDAGEVRALLFHVAASVVADRWRRAKVQHSEDHCPLDSQELGWGRSVLLARRPREGSDVEGPGVRTLFVVRGLLLLDHDT